jgi:hypothetical protein
MSKNQISLSLNQALTNEYNQQQALIRATKIAQDAQTAAEQEFIIKVKKQTPNQTPPTPPTPPKDKSTQQLVTGLAIMAIVLLAIIVTR